MDAIGALCGALLASALAANAPARYIMFRHWLVSVIRLDTGSSSLDCWPMALAALSAFEGSDSPASFVALVMEK